MSIVRPPEDGTVIWRAASARDFARYYSTDAGGGAARARARRIHDQITALQGHQARCLQVAEIGCGDGTGCRLWAEHGHAAHGLDRNQAMVNMARKRAMRAGLEIAFDLADGVTLPWPARSMDVCIAHDLLGEPEAWRARLAELVRVLKPGGVLYLSSNGRPPGVLRSHALHRQLRMLGLVMHDRVDLALAARPPVLASAALRLVRAVPPLRWCARAAGGGVALAAVKRGPGG